MIARMAALFVLICVLWEVARKLAAPGGPDIISAPEWQAKHGGSD